MDIGAITFGPIKSAEEIRLWQAAQSAMQTIGSTFDASAISCNCIGPQNGEKQCPCMLAVEMRKASKMIADGVVIAGRKYRLVPEQES